MYICNYLTLEQKQNGRNTLPKILKIIIEFLLAKGRDDFSQNLEIWLKSNWSWIYHWMVLYNFFYVLIEILRWLQLQDKFLHRKLGMRGVFFYLKNYKLVWSQTVHEPGERCRLKWASSSIMFLWFISAYCICFSFTMIFANENYFYFILYI